MSLSRDSYSGKCLYRYNTKSMFQFCCRYSSNLNQSVFDSQKSNELDSIDGLEHCRSVRYLNISNNRISSLATLRSMPRLMELRCNGKVLAVYILIHDNYAAKSWIMITSISSFGNSRQSHQGSSGIRGLDPASEFESLTALSKCLHWNRNGQGYARIHASATDLLGWTENRSWGNRELN